MNDLLEDDVRSRFERVLLAVRRDDQLPFGIIDAEEDGTFLIRWESPGRYLAVGIHPDSMYSLFHADEHGTLEATTGAGIPDCDEVRARAGQVFELHENVRPGAHKNVRDALRA